MVPPDGELTVFVSEHAQRYAASQKPVKNPIDRWLDDTWRQRFVNRAE